DVGFGRHVFRVVRIGACRCGRGPRSFGTAPTLVGQGDAVGLKRRVGRWALRNITTQLNRNATDCGPDTGVPVADYGLCLTPVPDLSGRACRRFTDSSRRL